MKKRSIKLLILLFIVISLCSGCFKRDEMEDINIITTVYPLEYVLNKLYGSNSIINSIYPDGVDTTQYKLTSKKYKDLSKKNLFIYNGLSKDKDIALKLLNKNKKILIMDSNYGMEYQNGVEELWLNPSNLLMISQNIKNGLQELIDSKIIKNEIDASYKELKVELSELDAEFKLLGENANNKTLVVASPALIFLEKYGFKTILIDDSDKNKNNIEEVISKINDKSVNCVFVLENDKESNALKKIKNELRKKQDVSPHSTSEGYKVQYENDQDIETPDIIGNVEVSIDESDIKRETETETIKTSDQTTTTITEQPIIDENTIKPEVKITFTEEKEDEPVNDFEDQIIDTLERIIKEDVYELEQLAYEIEILNQKQEDEVLTDETEKLKDQLEELIEKFEKIKNKYYYPDGKKIDALDIDDTFLYDLLQEYKEELKNTKIIDNIQEDIDHVVEYISIMDKIINVETQTNEIDEQIDEKLEDFGIRDEEFEIMKDEYQDLEEINSFIDSFNDKQFEIIKDIQSKVDESEKITKKIETDTKLVAHVNRLVEAAMLVALTKKIPPTPRGNIMKISMIASAINVASHFLTNEQTKKEITTIDYKDYEKDILSSMKDLSNIDNKLDTAFDDIKNMKEKFKKEFSEYSGQIKEFDELEKNLDNIEKELIQKKQILNKHSKQFDMILHQNNAKVKRLESENGKSVPINN